MNTRELFRRLQFLFHKRRHERELQEEMLLHRELRSAQLAEDGVRDPAQRASQIFGNSTLLKEKGNDMWGWRWLEDFGQDLRHTGRMLASNPGFAAITILTLALGIGANTAIFSATNALLLRGLPVHNPEQIFRVSCDRQPDRASNTGNPKTSFSDSVFQHLRKPNAVMSDLMAYVPLGFNKVSVRTGALPEEAAVDLVSGNFFTGLGVRPLCGRMLSMRDEELHSAAAVVSYGYAARRFGNLCASLGQPVFIKSVPLTVVGVAAKGFFGVESTVTDLWIPFQVNPELNAWGASGDLYSADPNWWCILMIARLRPGVSKDMAVAALRPAFQRAAYEPLGGKPASGEKPTSLHLTEARGIAGAEDMRKPLLILQTMVGFLLLIACGNVSMLLSVRNAARSREFSVRLALGGSQGRLFRQLLTESLTFVVCGVLAGLAFAEGASRILARWAELDISLAPDRTVLLFTLGVACAAELIFGIAPAIGAARVSIVTALKTSAATAHRDRSKITSGNVISVLQLALCLALLAGTGLLLRTLQKLENVNVGFRTGGLLVFGVNPHVNGEAQQIAFFRGLTDKLRSLPQVESVTLTENRIGSSWTNNTGVVVDGDYTRIGSTGFDNCCDGMALAPISFALSASISSRAGTFRMPIPQPHRALPLSIRHSLKDSSKDAMQSAIQCPTPRKSRLRLWESPQTASTRA